MSSNSENNSEKFLTQGKIPLIPRFSKSGVWYSTPFPEYLPHLIEAPIELKFGDTVYEVTFQKVLNDINFFKHLKKRSLPKWAIKAREENPKWSFPFSVPLKKGYDLEIAILVRNKLRETLREVYNKEISDSSKDPHLSVIGNKEAKNNERYQLYVTFNPLTETNNN